MTTQLQLTPVAAGIATAPVWGSSWPESFFELVFCDLFSDKPHDAEISCQDIMLRNLGTGVRTLLASHNVRQEPTYLVESLAAAVPVFVDGLGKRAQPFIQAEPLALEALEMLEDGRLLMDIKAAQSLQEKLWQRKEKLRAVRNRVDGFTHHQRNRRGMVGECEKFAPYTPPLWAGQFYGQIVRRLTAVSCLHDILGNILGTHRSSDAMYMYLGYGGSSDCLQNNLTRLMILTRPIPAGCPPNDAAYGGKVRMQEQNHYFNKFLVAFLNHFFDPSQHPSVMKERYH